MELSTTQQQRQMLSQQTIQSANILQMTAQELYTYLQETALENPVMEIRGSSALKEHPAFGSGLRRRTIEQTEQLNASDESNRYFYEQEHLERENRDPFDWQSAKKPQGISLSASLWEQLVSIPFRPKDEATLHYMLDSLDRWGYLREPLEQVAEKMGQPMERMEQLLFVVQSLEPAGVGARDLSECLLLQLERRMECPEQLRFIVTDCLELLAKNQIPAIAKKAQIPVKEASRLCQIVRSLNPKPGAVFSTEDISRYIQPDVLIVTKDGGLAAQLNDTLYPKLEIDQYYRQLAKTTEEEEVKSYLQEKISQVRWIRTCIAQRNETLMKVASAILEKQQDFFHSGPSALKPLKPSDIARCLDIHESTVSRAVRNKYLQCSQGIFPLSYFFSAKRLPSSKTAAPGQEESTVSTATAKAALRKLIRQEDKKEPLSDRALAEKLAEEGIQISRRTVAKYREAMEIPDASGRKDYSQA